MEAGKIYWIEGEFKHVGPLVEEFEHSVSRIIDSRLDKDSIKITTEPTDFGKGEVSFSIQLLRGRGFTYSGDFRDLEKGDFSGKADAELFFNMEGWVVMGNWFEYYENQVRKYFWISKISDTNAWQHFLKK
jgi:hypothetical protein